MPSAKNLAKDVRNFRAQERSLVSSKISKKRENYLYWYYLGVCNPQIYYDHPLFPYIIEKHFGLSITPRLSENATKQTSSQTTAKRQKINRAT